MPFPQNNPSATSSQWQRQEYPEMWQVNLVCCKNRHTLIVQQQASWAMLILRQTRKSLWAQKGTTYVHAQPVDLVGRFLMACEDRKEQQDKDQVSSVTLCSVTSARSAGSYGGFQGVPKWGQNRRGDITSTVIIPESLLPQENNRDHTRYRKFTDYISTYWTV